MYNYKILTMNPGSTSTKVAVYQGEELVCEEVLRHTAEELKQFPDLGDQYEYRKSKVINFLEKEGIRVEEFDAISARGGMINPLVGGTYIINKKMEDDLKNNMIHPSNLAGLIAKEIGEEYNKPCFVVDPPVVDEMSDVARVTGIPNIKRISIFHALNQKAVAKKIAGELGKKYEECNFIVTHVGGGVSIGAHCEGRVIDVNNVMDGEGPMSPNRAGSIPTGSLVDLCFSGEMSKEDIKKYLTSVSGIWAYLGTSDVRDVEALINEGNKEAELLYEALVYQISKSIGASATVLKGEVDAVILTGGVAYSKKFVGMVKERVGFIGNVIVSPGEEEMLALAQGAIRVLSGEEKPKEY